MNTKLTLVVFDQFGQHRERAAHGDVETRLVVQLADLVVLDVVALDRVVVANGERESPCGNRQSRMPSSFGQV